EGTEAPGDMPRPPHRSRAPGESVCSPDTYPRGTGFPIHAPGSLQLLTEAFDPPSGSRDAAPEGPTGVSSTPEQHPASEVPEHLTAGVSCPWNETEAAALVQAADAGLLEASLHQPVSPLALELKRQRREGQGRLGKATGATRGTCSGPQLRPAAAGMFLLPLSCSSTSS
ncbi:hypothetical protein EI555_006716, partial [Monodon monoceros]